MSRTPLTKNAMNPNFEFRIKDLNEKISITVSDRDAYYGDILGLADMPAEKFCPLGEHVHALSLRKDDEHAGEVYIETMRF